MATGIPGLDQKLGGGLLPGTLAVVVGATGIGKTQLGVQFNAAGGSQEGHRGIFFDLSYRGDAQSHADYAARMFDWRISKQDPALHPRFENYFAADRPQPDYLRLFDFAGRRATVRAADFDAYRDWHAEIVSRLNVAIDFFYGNFVRGTRRCVIDGVDPSDKQADSFQFELFDYVYHQILRKEHDWVARDLFRQEFRQHAAEVAAHGYDHARVGCLMLYTSHESMLEQLIDRPLDDRDWLAAANTVIYMGKIREGNRLSRGLYIAKHRGSPCSDEIIPYEIDDAGLRVVS
ncbi:MAG: recombinase RecA [Pirellulales bacterium]|nr:recombinase RecA [Pirellulales bacterium]